MSDRGADQSRSVGVTVAGSGTPGMIAHMPNQPRADNRNHPIRVEDKLWAEATIACAELGTSRSEVMRDALVRVVKKAERAREAPDRGPARVGVV